MCTGWPLTPNHLLFGQSTLVTAEFSVQYTLERPLLETLIIRTRLQQKKLAKCRASVQKCQRLKE